VTGVRHVRHGGDRVGYQQANGRTIRNGRETVQPRPLDLGLTAAPHVVAAGEDHGDVGVDRYGSTTDS